VDDEPVNPPPDPEGVDKRAWGPGPWQDEPDRALWVSSGLPCMLTRNPACGAWCGYVSLPPGHPWHGRKWFDLSHVRVHGNVTYAKASTSGLRRGCWLVGFDCSHYWDVRPVAHPELEVFAMTELAIAVTAGDMVHPPPPEYRDVNYARAQCELLARQALEAVG
jgi:hypothetical protein